MKRIKRLSTYYVNANASVCAARWFVINIILYGIAAWIISDFLAVVATMFCLVGIVQYWANLHGLRLLVPIRLNIIYGKHFKKFLKAHDVVYRKLN